MINCFDFIVGELYIDPGKFGSVYIYLGFKVEKMDYYGYNQQGRPSEHTFLFYNFKSNKTFHVKVKSRHLDEAYNKIYQKPEINLIKLTP